MVTLVLRGNAIFSRSYLIRRFLYHALSVRCVGLKIRVGQREHVSWVSDFLEFSLKLSLFQDKESGKIMKITSKAR